MKFLETKAGDLERRYEDIRDKCFASQSERRERYDMYRQYYLHGSVDDDCGGFNKIYPHIDQLCSFLYAQETTKFSVQITASVSDMELAKVTALNKAINDEWHASNGDTVFRMALIWALVYGSTFIKCRWNGEQIEPHIIDPHSFGVFREDAHGINKQEAFAHEFTITKSELERRLVEHPRREKIINTITWKPRASSVIDQQSTLSQVIVTAVQPTITGNVDFKLNSAVDYQPVVKEEVARVVELFMWDDKEDDYRVVTIADPRVVIYDRIQGKSRLFVKGEPCFVQICPTPVPGYFWGISEVERLKGIQDLRNKRMRQIDHILELQAVPPAYSSGFDGDVQEIQDTLDTPGGVVNTEMPNAKLEKLTPQVPDDLFQEVTAYDTMFEEMSGITNVMQGKGEAGVRSQSHASKLAQLGSSRTKSRALLIEDCLEEVSTLYLRIMQVFDKHRYRSDDGDEFIAHQFTEDSMVKVDAHSNSPIFSEDTRALMFELFKANAITREALINGLDPPSKQLLLQDLKTKIEPAEEAKAKQQLALELRNSGGSPAGGKPQRLNA